MSLDASEQVTEHLGQVDKIIVDIDITYAVCEILLGVDLSDAKKKTNIAIALVDFYVAKIEGKNEFAFGTKEYDTYDKKLRIWEDVIRKCLGRLDLKILNGSKSTDLQRKLATYFLYMK